MRWPRLLIATLLLALPVAFVAEAKPRRAKAAKTSSRKKKSVRKRPAQVKLRSEKTVVPATETASNPMPSRGPARIDFDDRLVQGQTNTSGSVYLYERKELRTESMLKMPDSFRKQTVQSVFGE